MSKIKLRKLAILNPKIERYLVIARKMDKGEICEKCVCLWREEMGKQIVGQYEVHIWKICLPFHFKSSKAVRVFPF